MGTQYVVKAGDCLSSIAFAHGLFWDTVWNHPDNGELKKLRKDPNVLLAGDVVFIPDRQPKEVAVATGKQHNFVVRSNPTKLLLRIMESKPDAPPPSPGAGPSLPSAPSKHVQTEDPEHQPVRMQSTPRANLPYTLVVDGTAISGTTDGDGKIEQIIRPDARNATLILEPDTPNERTIEVQLGHLDPLETVAGAKQRLANLGYECGDRTEEATADWTRALKAFQEHNGLAASGELDDATRAKVRERHQT
jgi:hypothetical protein